MKKFVLALFAIIFCTSCEKDIETLKSSIISGLTFYNYPITDCSTSASPLSTLIACELLGIDSRWEYNIASGEWFLEPRLNSDNRRKFRQKVMSTTTHHSFINLIDGRADLIFVARRMSADEKAHADAAGVSLIETPIARDAFIFIVHPDNPIESLTIEQIQDIYTAKIRNWENVGGNNAQIKPYVRNANSGSQELMESLVMQGLDMSDYFEVYNEFEYTVRNMTGALRAVSRDISANSICYTIHYYKEHIARSKNTKTIAINGIFPNAETIGNNTYPFVEPVYVVIRADLDKSSMAYKIYEWLQTEAGRRVISQSEYLLY